MKAGQLTVRSPLPTDFGHYIIDRPNDLIFQKYVGKTSEELRALGITYRREKIVREWEKPEHERSVHPALRGLTFEEWKARRAK